MKLTFSFLFFCCFFISSAQVKEFRTEGYYFYDNKIDTIYIARYTKDLKKMVSEAGYNTEGNDPCVPKGTVSLDGSSKLEFLAFTSNGTGAYGTLNCANKGEVRKCISNIMSMYTGANAAFAKENAISAIRFKKDNTFTANFGKSEHSFKKIEGKVFPDRIELKFIYPPMFQMYDAGKLKIFRFYKFGELPPLRSKFIYKYKAVPYN